MVADLVIWWQCPPLVGGHSEILANLVSKNVKFGKMAPQAPKILNAPPLVGGGMTPKAGGA